MIKVRFTYHIEPAKYDQFDPEDFAHCETIEELERELIECADGMVEWGVDVFPDSLDAMWAAVQKAKEAAE